MIPEADINGISTRSVDDLFKAMGMTGVSKSQVSRLCGELDERVGAFLNRQIEGDWPYLWIDATYVKTGEARCWAHSAVRCGTLGGAYLSLSGLWTDTTRRDHAQGDDRAMRSVP